MKFLKIIPVLAIFGLLIIKVYNFWIVGSLVLLSLTFYLYELIKLPKEDRDKNIVYKFIGFFILGGIYLVYRYLAMDV